jgi:hypothetical protein
VAVLNTIMDAIFVEMPQLAYQLSCMKNGIKNQ